MTTFSARDFYHKVSLACKSAQVEPVFITERGQPRYVLLDIEAYKALAGQGNNISELLAMPASDGAEIDFDPPTLPSHARAAEF